MILDLSMPKLNGVEAAALLRNAMPGIRIMILTLYPEDVPKDFVSLYHIDAVLAKANGLAELGAEVTRLLTDRTDDDASPRETMGAV